MRVIWKEKRENKLVFRHAIVQRTDLDQHPDSYQQHAAQAPWTRILLARSQISSSFSLVEEERVNRDSLGFKSVPLAENQFRGRTRESLQAKPIWTSKVLLQPCYLFLPGGGAAKNRQGPRKICEDGLETTCPGPTILAKVELISLSSQRLGLHFLSYFSNR